ncbi:MAG: PEP-CTERM sorting domain-containing protein [Planctomycetaceae bacterium]|nr:PEP-CTERM sorting domain-containing protein [Planctomycetaceae bacterium]
MSVDDSGQDILLTVIPEPATACLLAIGGLGVLLKRMRHRK